MNMKIVVLIVLVVLVMNQTRLRRKNKNKAIMIQQLDQVPCPTLFFLKNTEDDDLDHRRIGNEICTGCTVYSGCPDGQSCLRGLNMEVGPNIHSGVCMKLQDIYDHINELENNSLNFRTLYDEPDLVGEVSSRTFRTRFSRTQRTTLIKRVISSEVSTKDRKQRMVMSLGGRDALPPVAAEYILDAIPPQDQVWKDQINNIIDNGSPYYFNEFSPIEEIKPVGLDLNSLPPLKTGESYMEPPLIKYTGPRLIGKKGIFLLPTEKNNEGRQIKFGEPFIKSADPEQPEVQSEITEKTVQLLGANRCSIPPGCDEDGKPIDIIKAIKEAKKLKKHRKNKKSSKK